MKFEDGSAQAHLGTAGAYAETDRRLHTPRRQIGKPVAIHQIVLFAMFSIVRHPGDLRRLADPAEMKITIKEPDLPVYFQAQ